MKNILIDMTFIKKDYIAGVFIYAYRLVNGILDKFNSRINLFLLVNESNQNLVKENCPNAVLVSLERKGKSFLSKIPHLNGIINEKQIKKIINKYKIDVFFSPYFSYESYVVTSIPHLAVLHDAQTFILKKKQPIKGTLFRLIMRFLSSKVTRFLTISDYSKQDIIKHTWINESSISVVHNSVEMANEELYSRFKKIGPYILNVNTILPYKNLRTLILAFNLIKDKIEHILVIKGKVTSHWSNDLLPIIQKNKLENRIVLIDENLTPGQLTSLYKNADLFVTPSLMEGFGYSPIEAAICMVPVISSQETALPEITMGMVHYYTPTCDENALAQKILDCLGKTREEHNLENISLKFKKEYSVETQCNRIISLIEDV